MVGGRGKNPVEDGMTLLLLGLIAAIGECAAETAPDLEIEWRDLHRTAQCGDGLDMCAAVAQNLSKSAQDARIVRREPSCPLCSLQSQRPVAALISAHAAHDFLRMDGRQERMCSGICRIGRNGLLGQCENHSVKKLVTG